MTFDYNLLFDLALQRVGLPSREQLFDLCSKRILLGNEIQQLNLDLQTSPFPASVASDYVVQYREGAPFVNLPTVFLKRDFVRYDFQREWNNHGYGETFAGGESPFACSQAVVLPESATTLGEIFNTATSRKVSDSAALIETPEGPVLWFNRNVGPIDGYDWVIVENFLSSGPNPLPSIKEVPFGYSGALTMRIDCDEAVSSGRRLFELYRSKQIPFSMAIKTQQELGASDRELIEDVLAAGGSVVGHSHTHAPHWGGSRESAAWEIKESRRVLRALNIPGINYDFVVSPFHQNPPHSVAGLADAGIKGFVGGIICNDPEYLVGRSGVVPGATGIITHTQQCMLHGETYHQANNKTDGYKYAFKQALATRTFFGFLDHPFSNYWYGWESEEERLAVHDEFLTYLLGFDQIWKANLVQALRFLEMKSQVRISHSNGTFSAFLPKAESYSELPSICIHLGGKDYELNPNASPTMGETDGSGTGVKIDLD